MDDEQEVISSPLEIAYILRQNRLKPRLIICMVDVKSLFNNFFFFFSIMSNVAVDVPVGVSVGVGGNFSMSCCGFRSVRELEWG